VALNIELKISLYVVGFLMLLGTLGGRFVCGWICPFGFLQELLYKIPSPKVQIFGFLRFVKYIVLIGLVFIVPLIIADTAYTSPLFCKFLCPAGSLEAGIPLAFIDQDIRKIIGTLFYWKMFILVIFIVFSIISKRAFCRVICPLGAFYGIFNKISIYKMDIDEGKCTKCNKCQKICPVDHRVYSSPNSPECIRCNDCIKICPENAINRGIIYKKEVAKKNKSMRCK
jgi:polyferredoxin